PVRTSEARGVDAFGGSPSAFHLTPGSHWRWPCSRGGSGGVTTGGAIIWGAGREETGESAALYPPSCGERLKMEPVKMPQQREEKADHEQEYVDMKGHNDPRF